MTSSSASAESRSELQASPPLPWAAASTDSLPPEGQVAAWEVHPPRPDPTTQMPPVPVEPANPQLTRPPLTNPGGVNGTRPPRSPAVEAVPERR